MAPPANPELTSDPKHVHPCGAVNAEKIFNSDAPLVAALQVTLPAKLPAVSLVKVAQTPLPLKVTGEPPEINPSVLVIVPVAVREPEARVLLKVPSTAERFPVTPKFPLTDAIVAEVVTSKVGAVIVPLTLRFVLTLTLPVTPTFPEKLVALRVEGIMFALRRQKVGRADELVQLARTL
jgi:hypothetical protein